MDTSDTTDPTRHVPSGSELRPRFHLAMPVHDLAAARGFYGDLLGCPEGAVPTPGSISTCTATSSSPTSTRALDRASRITNPVDGDDVPVPHFGVLLSPVQWHDLAERLRAAGTTFVIEPHTRFAGEVGEQSTMFLLDPSGNALEFKAFADDSQVFAR
jgi:uncharacterized protein